MEFVDGAVKTAVSDEFYREDFFESLMKSVENARNSTICFD